MDIVKGTVLIRYMNKDSKSEGEIPFLISENMDIYRMYRKEHGDINDPYFTQFEKQEVEVEGEIQESNFFLVERLTKINLDNRANDLKIMKKICTKCNRTVEGIEANGKFCSQCGTELTELPVSSTPSGVSINEDNRIDKSVHTGDNIKVGGDNAQTINKQQVSTTNITNIQQIQQDETKKIVNCAISGKAVLLIKTANCPKCHRCVSQEYYIDSKRMCTDCYEKQYGHAYDPLSSTPTTIRPTTSSNSYRQQAKTEGVGTLMGNGTRPTPPATPTPGTSVSNNSSTSPILYIAIAAAIGVGGYFLFSNKGSEKQIFRQSR